MMRKLLLFLLICNSYLGYGQDISAMTIDEARQKLRNAADPGSKMEALLKLESAHFAASGRKIYVKSLDSAFYYATAAEKLGKSLGNDIGLGRSYIALSYIYKKKSKRDKAEEYAKKAIAIFKPGNHKSELAAAYLAQMNSKDEDSENEEMITLGDKAIALYRETGQKKKEAHALQLVAFEHLNMADFESTVDKTRKSIDLYKSIGFQKIQKNYGVIALVSHLTGKYDAAVENALEGIRIVERFNEESLEDAEVYDYAGMVFTAAKDWEKAEEYFKKGYEIAKKHDYKALTEMLQGNIIQTLTQTKNNKQAIVYLKEMEKGYSDLSESGKWMFLKRIVIAYSYLGEYDKAAPYVETALKFSAKLPYDHPNQLWFYPGFSKYYLETKQYDLARKYLEGYKAVAQKIHNLAGLEEVHKMMFKLDSEQSRFDSALSNYKRQQAYKDTLFNIEKLQQISKLQIQYETEKKDRDLLFKEKNIKLLKKESQLQQSKIEQANLVQDFTLAGIAVLAITMLLLGYSYRIKQRSNTKLNKVLSEKEQLLEELGLKRDVLERLVTEKELLLKEIHHRVKNNLQIVMSLLNSQAHYLDNEAAMLAIRNSQHRIQSMSLIHKKLYQSSNVTSINMQDYISELVEYFRSCFDTGNRIQFITDVQAVSLHIDQAVPIGLILNELLTNAIKHAFPEAGTGCINIQLRKLKDGQLRLGVYDNGIGLPTDGSAANVASLGMELVKGLAKNIEAQLRIDSKDGLSVEMDFMETRKMEIKSA